MVRCDDEDLAGTAFPNILEWCPGALASQQVSSFTSLKESAHLHLTHTRTHKGQEWCCPAQAWALEPWTSSSPIALTGDNAALKRPHPPVWLWKVELKERDPKTPGSGTLTMWPPACLGSTTARSPPLLFLSSSSSLCPWPSAPAPFPGLPVPPPLNLH